MDWFSFHFADFAFSFLSILLEGVPFLLLGSLISGAVEVFLPGNYITKNMPKNPVAATLLGGVLGALIPMCECGSVVVIRRFLAKGLPVSFAVTYMLAAPIVSPVVAVSTFMAFRGQSPFAMTSLRLMIGYGIAVAVGLVVSQLLVKRVLNDKLLATLPSNQPAEEPAEQQSVTTANPDGSGAKVPAKDKRTGVRIIGASDRMDAGEEVLFSQNPFVAFFEKVSRVMRAASSDFLDVALFFVIGAAIAATFNTAVDQTIILPLAENSTLAVPSMMLLASGLALCSSTDAFIAASFTVFPFAAKLAFLTFGPVFDVKLVFLYGMIFRRKFVAFMAIGLFVVIALICLQVAAWEL